MGFRESGIGGNRKGKIREVWVTSSFIWPGPRFSFWIIFPLLPHTAGLPCGPCVATSGAWFEGSDTATCFCFPGSDKVSLSVCTKHVLLKGRAKLGGGGECECEGQGKWVVEKADETVSLPARQAWHM